MKSWKKLGIPSGIKQNHKRPVSLRYHREKRKEREKTTWIFSLARNKHSLLLRAKTFHKYIIFAEKPQCVFEGTASITLNPCGTHPG